LLDAHPQAEKIEKDEEAAHGANYYPKGPVYVDKEIRLDSYLNQGSVLCALARSRA
jgi:hypothetical protein